MGTTSFMMFCVYLFRCELTHATDHVRTRSPWHESLHAWFGDPLIAACIENPGVMRFGWQIVVSDQDFSQCRNCVDAATLRFAWSEKGASQIRKDTVHIRMRRPVSSYVFDTHFER